MEILAYSDLVCEKLNLYGFPFGVLSAIISFMHVSGPESKSKLRKSWFWLWIALFVCDTLCIDH